VKAEALAFAQFLTNKENQILRFEQQGVVPTNLEARKSEKVQSDVCAKAITEQLKYSKIQVNVPSTLWAPMEGLGNAMITGVQNGSFNVKEQLAACVAGIEK
jgi:arabinogalactan oligomer/maltooligosaccharide transport system substrate-binding protein